MQILDIMKKIEEIKVFAYTINEALSDRKINNKIQNARCDYKVSILVKIESHKPENKNVFSR